MKMRSLRQKTAHESTSLHKISVMLRIVHRWEDMGRSAEPFRNYHNNSVRLWCAGSHVTASECREGLEYEYLPVKTLRITDLICSCI